MSPLRRALKIFAWLGAGLTTALVLLVLALWALGTRGVPLTADLAVKLMSGQLAIARAEGGWFGPIVLEGLRYDSPGSTVEVDRLMLDWAPSELWARRTLVIGTLDIGTLSVTLKPTPPTPPQPLKPTLARDVELHALSIARLRFTPAGGTPQGFDALRLRGSWIGPDVTVEALELSHAVAGLVKANAKASLAPSSVTLRSLSVEGPGLLEAQGVLGLLGETSDLTATLRDGRWPLTAPTVRVPALTATARGVLTGAPLDLALTLKGALRTAIEEQSLGFDLDGAMQLKTDGAHIERLALRSTDGAGSLTAAGDAAWRPALRVDAQATFARLDPGVLLPEWKGELNGVFAAETVDAATTDGIPEVRFDLQLDRSRLRGYPVQLDARGLAALQGETRRLQLDALTLVSGSTRLQGRGEVLPALDATLALDARDLRTLLPSLAGSVSLTVEAEGEPKHPAVRAKGRANGLRHEGRSLAQAEIDLDYAPQKDSRVDLKLRGVDADGLALESAQLEGSGRVERHMLKLTAVSTSPKAQGSVELAGAADLDARRWTGQLQKSSFMPPYGPAWQQQEAAALTLSAEQQQLAATCWRAGVRSRFCLDATHAPPSTRVAYRVEQLDTADFAALLPKDWVIQTVADGRGEIALDGATPTTLDLDLSLGAGRIAVPGAPALALLPSTLAVHQEQGQWQARARLAVDRGTASVDATLPVSGGPLMERPLDGKVVVAVPDLSWLAPMVPGVSALAGVLDGDFTLAGTAQAPAVEGALSLKQGLVRIDAAGITARNIEATVRGSRSGPMRIEARAESGGALKLDGTVEFAGGRPVAGLRIVGDNVQVADIADARVWVSPDLRFEQGAEGMRLTGTVTVPKAEITPRNLQANAIGVSRDQVLVGVDAPETKALALSAEVNVVLGDAVSFEGFGLKSKVQGRLLAIDTPGSGGTRGRGELRLIDAAYKAYGQEIQVQTGRILFNGGPITEPTVDIIARRSPREDVSVSLHVRGTLTQPTFDLSSSPAMPREQQLGWLLFGRPIDGGAGGDLSGAAAALSLGIAGGDALASRIGKVIGLDQVSLGADSTSTAWQSANSALPRAPGTEQTRFTVGKYLSPKLFVSYGVGLFDNGNVLRLLYDLGRGFKLRTETATAQSGGDVLYSVDR